MKRKWKENIKVESREKTKKKRERQMRAYIAENSFIFLMEIFSLFFTHSL